MSDDFAEPTPGPRRRRKFLLAAVLLVAALLGGWGWKAWQDSLPERLRDQSQEAVAAGRWQEVAEAASRLTEIDPQDGEAWLMRARAAHALGDPAGSATLLSQMPADNREKMMALRQLADLQLGPLNAPLAAEETLRQALQRDSRSNFAHERLIFIYAMTLQRQKLAQQARSAIELQCEPVEAYVYLFFADDLIFTDGAERNGRWKVSDPNSELFRVAEAVYIATTLKGGVIRDERKVVERIRRLADEKDRVLAELFLKYPRNLELLAWHIGQAIEQGDVTGTVELLRTVPTEADNDNRFRRFAGWAHARLGRQEEAAADYLQALKLNPLDWSTRHLLAALRREQEKPDEVERLEQVVQKASELSRALKLLPDARAVDRELLAKLLDYATLCGDELYARGVRRQLNLIPDPRRHR
jgi:Flp pilus assembly protein TadD